jgi:aminopeptidase YwaD
VRDVAKSFEVSPANLTRHLRILTEQIGVRLAGSPGEQKAVEYIAHEFEKIGATTSIESFPIMARDVSDQSLEVHSRDGWHKFPCSLFAGAPGTSGKMIEAPMVFFESPAERQRTDLADLRDKAVVHLGSHFESREFYKRLIDAKPAFLLCVDIRYPGDSPLADGLFPVYVKALGAVPTINVAYLDAWRWRATGADTARLRVVGGMRPGQSSNVVASLTGESNSDEILIVGAHHDTQADSVGADDNATGVVGLLELARVLSRLPRRRAIRFISFGTEEQLSVGSAAYVRAHRHELERKASFVFNLDSFGSRLGWNELLCDGSKQWSYYLRQHFEARRVFAKLTSAISPYVDAFPFQALGIPAATLMRENCTSGRFFHHRPDDDMTRIDPDLMARLLTCVTSLLDNAANSISPPFEGHLSQQLRSEAKRWWNELFES